MCAGEDISFGRSIQIAVSEFSICVSMPLIDVEPLTIGELSRIAKERGAGSLCYAEAMLVAYNRKCKYTLRMTKLHSGKVAAEDDFVEENEEPLADDPVLEE